MIPSRQCYWIDAGQSFNPELKKEGYVPSLVRENEAGHRPLMGRPGGSPWYWGKTLAEAQSMVERANRETFDLSPQDVAEIVASSMGAQNAQRQH